MRRTAALLVAVAAALLLAPAAAHAHAVLQESTPSRGAALDAAPDAVALRFNEAVEGSFGAVRVFDADAERVDDNRVIRAGGDRTIGVGLRDVPDGTYVATYRVLSADGHPVSGGFVFTVGEAAGSDAPAVADLIGDEAGPVTDAAFGAVRGVTYGATALLLGGLAFLLLVVRRAGATLGAAAARRGRRIAVGAAAAGALAGLAGLVLQGASAGGTSFWTALDPGVLHDVLATRFGEVWAIRAATFVLLGAVAAAGLRTAARAPAAREPEPALLASALPVPPRPLLVLAGLGVTVLAVAPALGGHPAATEPSWALVPLNVLHVAATSVWLGGLAALLLVVPAATRALEPSGRTRLLARLLVRFSPLALASVVVLVATGVGQSLLHVDEVGALWDTAFGRAVAAKVLLLALLVGLGVVQRNRILPALRRAAADGDPPGGAGRMLRRALRAEVVLAVGVLAATSALVAYAPPDAIGDGPYATTTAIGERTLEATLDPARVGPNALHLYLLDARTGAPFDGTKDLRVTFALPAREIGPLDARPRKAGPGHYVVEDLPLVPAGDWRIVVASRVSEFEEHRATLEVEIE